MAYIPVLGDYGKATFVFVNAEQVALPSLVYQILSSTGATPPTQGQIAANLGITMGAGVLPLMGTDSTFRGTMFQVFNRTPRPAYEFSFSGGGAGSNGGLTLPRQTSLAIKLTTSLAGRSYRGRFYTPFPTASYNLAGGVPNNTYANAWATIMNVLLGPITVTVGGGSTNILASIWHRSTRTADTITGFATTLKWATIRRRGSYGRANTAPF